MSQNYYNPSTLVRLLRLRSVQVHSPSLRTIRLTKSTLILLDKSAIAVSEVQFIELSRIGCQAWIRTKIDNFRGYRPTVRRPGNTGKFYHKMNVNAQISHPWCVSFLFHLDGGT